jgi:hypothetical protein
MVYIFNYFIVTFINGMIFLRLMTLRYKGAEIIRDKIPGIESLSELRRTAKVIVHKDFSKYNHYSEDESKLSHLYGKYEDYKRNIDHLVHTLSDLKVPFISVIPLKEYNDKELYRKYSIKGSVEIIAGGEEFYASYFSTPELELKKDIDHVMDVLEKNGVEKIQFAGEWVWFQESDYGCVTKIADRFSTRFDISGIKGCMFPLHEPNPKHDLPLGIHETGIRLYRNQDKVV